MARSWDSRSTTHCMHSAHYPPCDSYNEGEVELMAPSRPHGLDAIPPIVTNLGAHTSSVADQPWHANAVEIGAKPTLLLWLCRDGLTRDVQKPLQLRVVALRL